MIHRQSHLNAAFVAVFPQNAQVGRISAHTEKLSQVRIFAVSQLQKDTSAMLLL